MKFRFSTFCKIFFSSILICSGLFADSELFLEDYKFLSYGKLSTWKGVTVDWKTDPRAFIYDRRVFKGHSDFISKGLGKKITFEEFRSKAKFSKEREYLPFYVYDLRDVNVTIKEKKFRFALRLQDYRYDDSPIGMAEEISKLIKILSRDSGDEFDSKPLIILNKQKMNVLSINTLGELMSQAGYSFVSLDRLLELTGGKKVEVLNSGIAVGQLKLIKSERQAETLTGDDIALLTFLPDRLPPVAGIITLQPQTPLSHVNLLAKNRGTFNMYVMDMNSLPNLKKLIGHYVYLDDKENEVSINKVNKKFVENYRLKNQPRKVEIEPMNPEFSSLMALVPKYESYHKASYIGAKAQNYYKILGIIPEFVRPAYAIGFKPYLEVLEQGAKSKIEELIENKQKWNVQKRREKLKEIRETIKISNFPEPTLKSIRKVINKHYKNKRIRFRSSTNCEDLKGFNGAGLYTSKGFNTIENDDAMSEKLLEVYASFWNDYAFEEREYYGIPHMQTGMAILVHESFSREKANGVALTIPKGKDGIEVLVNVQSGSLSVANPISGNIAESFYINIADTNVGRINTRSNIKNVFVDNPEYLSILKDLNDSILKIHKSFKETLPPEDTDFGIDIEFKIMEVKDKPKLFIKQARILKY